MGRKTFLYEEHKRLGAKMFDFAGWEMPLQYTSVKEEHLNVRSNSGIFDVSHMGQVFVSGKDSLAYIQNLVPRDLADLKEGKAVYSTLVNTNGGIIDDLIIYKLPDKYLLIVNASRVENDLNWLLESKNNYDVVIDNQSDNYSMIAVQGPKSSEILDKLGLKKENQLVRFGVAETSLAGIDVILARTGYTGEDGFEILVKNEDASKLWNEFLDKKDFGLKPVGYAARDTLRLEASLLLYGQDMDEKTSPVEASLCWTISKDKKDDYPGKQVILDQIKNKNYKKKLVRFKMLDKSVPRHDYEIYIENQNAGQVTSGGFSPCSSIGIGLGYVDTAKIANTFADGIKIDIMIRGKLHPAQITKKPFYNKNYT